MQTAEFWFWLMGLDGAQIRKTKCLHEVTEELSTWRKRRRRRRRRQEGRGEERCETPMSTRTTSTCEGTNRQRDHIFFFYFRLFTGDTHLNISSWSINTFIRSSYIELLYINYENNKPVFSFSFSYIHTVMFLNIAEPSGLPLQTRWGSIGCLQLC